MDFPALQNLIKRDPESYTNEFLSQYRHFQAKLEIFRLSPHANDSDFTVLVNFIAHVYACFPKIEECQSFPLLIIDLLRDFHQQLVPDIRRSLVQSLILLRNKNLVQIEILISLFFVLFRCHDKSLRSLLHSHIVSDIKTANQKAKNNKLNKTLQNYMYTMLKDSNDIAAKQSLLVMIDLYKKQIWNDAKTVNVISEACFSNVPKLLATSLNFFLGKDKEEEESDDEDGFDIKSLKHSIGINKKTKSRKRQYENALTLIKKKEKSSKSNPVFNFSALQLLNDPQVKQSIQINKGFAEKLFSKLKQAQSNHHMNFELRILMMNLTSRLIGVHKLLVLGFYEYVVPFLKPSQKHVTSILAFTAQASHDLIPPQDLEPVVNSIANQFVWSNCSSEVIVAGLNGMREICSRCPLSMNETLLQSLIDDFKKHNEKGVMIAVRGLIGLYREANPELLKKRDRGKKVCVSGGVVVQVYGQQKAPDNIAGIEYLNQKDDEDSNPIQEVGWEEWELDNDKSQSQSDDEWNSVDGENNQDDEEEQDEEEQDEDEEDNDNNEIDIYLKNSKQIVTERLLTDEEFAKIKRLRIEKEAEKLIGFKSKKPIQDSDDEGESKDFIDPTDLLSGIKRKDDYAARLESIRMGRQGREKFGSKKSKRDNSSTTNKQKQKKKAFLMCIQKSTVKGKAKRSLKEKQKVLCRHIKKQKLKTK